MKKLIQTKNKKIIFLVITLVLAIGIITNFEVSIRQGVDGHYSTIKMPLYVKWVEFLARHYEYKRVAKDIAKGHNTEEEKVIAILNWVHKNIRAVPPGMPIADDHILYIIIRGYGVPEQFQDVFTTLCAYSNIPAFWRRIYVKNRRTRYTLSFVKLNGKWRVFDAYYGKFFRTRNGEIASVEDIINDKGIITGENIDNISIEGVPYKEFYYNLKSVTKPAVSRPEKQMPFRRLIFEIRKLLGAEQEDNGYLVS